MANATIDEDPSSIRSKSLVSRSMSALPARTAFAQRPVDAVDVEMTEASSPPQKDVQDDVLIGAKTPGLISERDGFRTESNDAKPACSIAWTKAMTNVNDFDELIAVEAMKTVCHEIVGAKNDVAAHGAMVGDIEPLVSSLVKRMEHVFITRTRASAPSPSANYVTAGRTGRKAASASEPSSTRRSPWRPSGISGP